MKNSIAILCGGGPAPGINAVISTLVKIFIKEDYRVIGIHDGYRTIFTNTPNIDDLDFEYADKIFSLGGSSLRMSRYKPKDSEFNTDFFVNNNVKLLVTIGGDDTASTANRIGKFLASKNIDISNIHVPKTIDNDLPLPDRNPTFGFHSAKDEGVRIGNTIYEDARTSKNWFVLSTMGREAGHLAFGIGMSCHFPMVIIPEMFNKSSVTLDKITRLLVSTILKRLVENIPYGVSIISEGVFHFMDEDEIKNSGINFTYDDHGHPELGNVSKSHIFNVLLQQKLKSLNIEIKSRPVEMGYELRCCRPIGFDLTLCTLLAMGVKKLYKQGLTGCLVSANSNGDIKPIYLKDLEGPDGKIKPRLVDINSEMAKLLFSDLHYITPVDYEKAKLYVPHPEEYDFNKILGW
ncbi:6-phosphofructokinase [Flavobacterium cellulosilyticum]|uniref:6-phosphofructokinase n=1 Tax=Flavobacterium cellulosilyticum TaxID=2541731 RepID=A0A4R5CI27_9FLAO|nr:6-phosphofructokinase [Flavobacterium cellulosilyticum]TDD98746.1 6-phosphofructokinase [Flavobacterium cellulosilyticum]